MKGQYASMAPLTLLVLAATSPLEAQATPADWW